MKKVLLGVYGTLKQGYHNYDVFLSPIKPFLTGKFTIPYQLYSNGRYPMLVRKGSSEVFLEIYEISEELFLKIKNFETPFGYHVERITIDGKKIHIFVSDHLEPPVEFRVVPNRIFVAEIAW